MNAQEFVGRMREQQAQRRRYRAAAESSLGPGEKAAETKRRREEARYNLPPDVYDAIRNHFRFQDVACLNPAEKAHLTRGSYNYYLAAW